MHQVYLNDRLEILTQATINEMLWKGVGNFILLHDSLQEFGPSNTRNVLGHS